MNKRRLSLPLTDLKQTGITQFVERELKKDQPIQFIGARRSSQPGANSIQTPGTSSSRESAPNRRRSSQPGANSIQTVGTSSSTESALKKRTRPEVSGPDSSTEKQPSK